MDLGREIKRKLFHHLSLVYLLLYWFLPRGVVVGSLLVAGILLAGVEFIRLRRPELNAWFLAKFGGIHRESEILGPSGIFWTLLGCWLTIFLFASKRIVVPALAFLVLGDTFAALVGKKWGKHPWPSNPAKTLEGSAAFVVVSLPWPFLFELRSMAALIGAVGSAWVEAHTRKINDNVWIPLMGALFLSLANIQPVIGLAFLAGVMLYTRRLAQK